MKRLLYLLCLSVDEFASELTDCLPVDEFASALTDCLPVDECAVERYLYFGAIPAIDCRQPTRHDIAGYRSLFPTSITLICSWKSSLRPDIVSGKCDLVCTRRPVV